MKKEKLEFYGGPYAALIPILFYVFLSFIFVLVLHVSLEWKQWKLPFLVAFY